jgi:hypothetical protein
MNLLIFVIAITHSFFQTPDIPRLESPSDSEVIFPKIASTTFTDRSVEVPDAGFKKRLHDHKTINLFNRVDETEKSKREFLAETNPQIIEVPDAGFKKRIQGFPKVTLPKFLDGIEVPDAGFKKRIQDGAK